MLMVSLANLFAVYAAKARAPADEALREAAAFKAAGSIALRRGAAKPALEQYGAGAEAAARLASMWYLNAPYRARGRALLAALLNNSALVLLKQEQWERAVGACTRCLELHPPEPLVRAKS
jgi:hypothetical protein